jgi:hypothetical protein
MCDAFVLQEQGDRAKPVEGLPEREQVKLIVLGSVAGVKEQIHKLHVLGFADAVDWSRLWCCARPVVDFFERLASRAFQKNQQQI